MNVSSSADRPRLDPELILMWLPAVSMMLLSALSYSDHSALAGLAPSILRESGLSAGLGGGAWSLVVAVEMPAVGRLFDLHGDHIAFPIAPLIPIADYAAWRASTRGLPEETDVP